MDEGNGEKRKRDVDGEVNGGTLQVENEEKDPEADTERPSSRFILRYKGWSSNKDDIDDIGRGKGMKRECEEEGGMGVMAIETADVGTVQAKWSATLGNGPIDVPNVCRKILFRHDGNGDSDSNDIWML
ncbi:hypothetical protein PV325_002560 [Microctonus aethiopoides]|nr:hypothetical protein PV325_002560 [Microctonus aethiopoides]KAK0088794.1 hypothetical protein PV326_004724 [Microctonus aethiopoides]